MNIKNSFTIENETFYYYDLSKVFEQHPLLRSLPIVLKILLEANLRKASGSEESERIINVFLNRTPSLLHFYPSRIIMQDFSALSSLVDLATMRDKVQESGGNVQRINPQVMVDVVIDHSLDRHTFNVQNELEENDERYSFVKWAKNAFDNVRVVPPGSGLCHQVNLEYLSSIIHLEQNDGKNILYPETLIGTKSDTSVINSLGVLAWGVNNLDAQKVMLGLPLSLKLPKVVGVHILGELKEGMTSSDLVLIIKDILKKRDLNGKLLEFYGVGIDSLSLEDRSSLTSLAPEYGALSAFFAIDYKTIDYYNKTRVNDDFSRLIKTYLEKQSMFFHNDVLSYDEKIELNLSLLISTVIIAKRSHDEISLQDLKKVPILRQGKYLKDADIVLASIESCSLNSNPYLLIHAGLILKKICELGIEKSNLIHANLFIGPAFVKQYLKELGLLQYFEIFGFNIIDLDVHTCSIPTEVLDTSIEEDIKFNSLNVVSLMAGNNDFEGKVHPLVESNYLMSPSIVIVYIIAQTIHCNILEESLCSIDGQEIKLHDIWPGSNLLGEYLNRLNKGFYKNIYKDIYKGNQSWQELEFSINSRYPWNNQASYIQPSLSFNESSNNGLIEGAHILALLGDHINTEDISPSGQISLYCTASSYLEEKGVKSFDYNSYESRGGNSELMLHSMFDNTNIKNKMVSKEGGFTKDFQTHEIVSIYELSQKLKKENKASVIFAGYDYGCGKEREWAIKGVSLLGVKVIIAQSFNATHKLNLIEFGVLPLEFTENESIESLGLKGDEIIDIEFEEANLFSTFVNVVIQSKDRTIKTKLRSCLESKREVELYKEGGILVYLLKNMIE